MVSQVAVEESLEVERECIEEAQRGNPNAMRPIFESYAQPLFSTVILPRTGDQATAEDILRDTFVTAIEKIHKFRWTGRSIYVWLRQIAVNKVYDLHRKTKRTQRLTKVFALEMPTHTGADERPDCKMIAAQERQLNRQRIEDTLSKISDRYRTAIELRLIQEIPREECAAALGIAVATFDVVLHRAVRAFRKNFGERD